MMRSPVNCSRSGKLAGVNRILEQYLALEHYFVLVANEDRTQSNDRIFKSLQNKFTLAYLEFLSHQLQRFNAFNSSLSKRKAPFTQPQRKVEGLIKSIASDFMSIAYVKQVKPKEIDPTRTRHTTASSLCWCCSHCYHA